MCMIRYIMVADLYQGSLLLRGYNWYLVMNPIKCWQYNVITHPSLTWSGRFSWCLDTNEQLCLEFYVDAITYTCFSPVLVQLNFVSKSHPRPWEWYLKTSPGLDKTKSPPLPPPYTHTNTHTRLSGQIRRIHQLSNKTVLHRACSSSKMDCKGHTYGPNFYVSSTALFSFEPTAITLWRTSRFS